MKRSVIFVRQQGETVHQIDEIELKENATAIEYKEGEKGVPIPQGASLVVKDKAILYFDVSSNAFLSFFKNKLIVDADTLDIIIYRKIIEQIMRALKRDTETPSKGQWIIVILALGLGLVGGFLAGQYVTI